jgi:hypothetical protein
MITNINLENPTILSIQVEGDITVQDITQYSNNMELEKSNSNYNGIYIQIDEMSNFRLSGLNLLKDHLIKQEHLLKEVDRIALVVDDDLLHKMARLEDSMDSNIERRAFYSTDKSIAKNWITK